jgi:hypothetical protein
MTHLFITIIIFFIIIKLNISGSMEPFGIHERNWTQSEKDKV